MHVETIVLSQLASTIKTVKTVKTVKIQLDDLVARQACYGDISPHGTSKVTMAIAHAQWYNIYIAIYIT